MTSQFSLSYSKLLQQVAVLQFAALRLRGDLEKVDAKEADCCGSGTVSFCISAVLTLFSFVWKENVDVALPSLSGKNTRCLCVYLER